MTGLEKRNKERVRKASLQQAILNTVKVAGVLSIGLLAPNAIGAMEKLGLMPKPRQREYISSSASKLTKRGLLKFENGRYTITLEGQNLLRKWELEDYRIIKPRKWDKKWRMIIFDIPEKKRRSRTKITDMFRRAGLYRLQDSVWIHPYDCENIIGLLKTEFGVGKNVLYIIAEEIENDKHLRREFGLS